MTGEFTAAVHAVVYLNHKAAFITSEEIAQNVCTNPARIRKIMAKLKKAGLVQTKEGAVHGGYRFGRHKKTVTLLMIADAIGEKFVSAAWRSGNADMDCLIAAGMANVMDQIFIQMDDACRKILQTITIEEIDKQIFKK